MGWKEKEPDKSQWQEKNQPPDLEEMLKTLQQKLRKWLSNGRSSTPSKKSPSSPSKGLHFFFAAFAFLFVLLWGLSGIFIVNPAEQAAILRFGKYIRTVGPGPHWIPRIFESQITINVDRISDYSYSAQMLTKDENLVSVSLAVQYKISDLEAYLFRVASPQESLQQATSSALRQVVGTTTLDQIITEGREALSTQVQTSLIKILDSYKTGIAIVNVSPQPARAPENVQDAFDDAIKAQEDEKRFKEQAYAYQATVVPIAEGRAKRILAEAEAFAQQTVLKAKGDVAAFLALLPAYKEAPFVTTERMYLDTMQEVFKHTTKIIVDTKAGNLLYLPLERLGTRSPLLSSSPNTPEEKIARDIALQRVSKNLRLLQRESTRATLREGRNPS